MERRVGRKIGARLARKMAVLSGRWYGLAGKLQGRPWVNNFPKDFWILFIAWKSIGLSDLSDGKLAIYIGWNASGTIASAFSLQTSKQLPLSL